MKFSTIELTMIGVCLKVFGRNKMEKYYKSISFNFYSISVKDKICSSVHVLMFLDVNKRMAKFYTVNFWTVLDKGAVQSSRALNNYEWFVWIENIF